MADKDIRVNLRMSQKEKEGIEALARALDLSLTDVCRLSIALMLRVEGKDKQAEEIESELRQRMVDVVREGAKKIKRR
jgi:hypothetical protein